MLHNLRLYYFFVATIQLNFLDGLVNLANFCLEIIGTSLQYVLILPLYKAVELETYVYSLSFL